ncbi:hypothetical protein [Paenibacillus sp. Soil724D2]|uniref:hypothetical protein n=1 Tax=Paenibacillus sp. (strain Soil724D2) TaxID=1736392 RepID=UPI000714CA82|nr:hypothetical protein [Paenibacillus sp. Soil724D2]KRE33430.1 hypothetical protein ASG85_14280 [Paenibacillus sp. Soil724D2]
MGVVKNIVVRAIADFSGLITGSQRASDAIRNMGNRINGSSTIMGNALNGIGGKLAALAGIYVSFDFLKTATNDAIKFDAQMETLNNRMGASAVMFNNWADTMGRSLGLSKMQIAEYGNTYSNMLYDAAKDQEDLANKTSKFLELSAIVRSKTGLSQEEVSKRMRSAMNMEADGADELGINVRATAVEQSKAFKALAGGVEAFSDLNSGTQKAIMYTYILDEVTRRYGTSVSMNANTQTAQFIASLKDLALHLGQAFLPIWTTVLPALTTLVSWLDSAAKKAAVFMRVMFGYSATDTTKSAQDSTQAFKGQQSAVNGLTDAHKKLAKAKAGVAGFDQVNVLPDKADADAAAAAVGAGAEKPSKGGGSADGNHSAGGNQPVMDDVDSEIGAEGLANKFKKAVQDMKDAWQGFKDSIKANSDIILMVLGGVAAVILALSLGAIANAVIMSVSWVASMIPVIASTLAWAAAMIIANLPIILIMLAIFLLGAAIVWLVLHWKEVKEWTLKVWDACWEKIKEVGKGIAKVFDDMITAVSDWGMGVAKHAAAAFDSVAEAFKGAASWFYDNVIKPIVDFFVQFALDIGAGAVKVYNALCEAFKTAGTWFKTNVIDPIVTKFGLLKEEAKTAASNAWTEIKNVFSVVGSWFGTNIVNPIKTAFSGIADGLGDGVVIAFKAVYRTVAGYLNGMLDIWNSLTGSNPLTSSLQIGFRLPALAKGGITNGPMAALIGDNSGGREVVSPLSDLTGHISTAVIQALAFSNTGGNSKNNDNRDIILNIDGRQFARIVKPYMDDQNGSTTVMLNRI